MTQKNFSFAKKFSLPLYFVSAADGTNVVKVLANQRQSAEAAYGSWSSREKGKGGNQDSEWLGAAERNEAGRTTFGETKSTDCGIRVMRRDSGGGETVDYKGRVQDPAHCCTSAISASPSALQ